MWRNAQNIWSAFLKKVRFFFVNPGSLACIVWWSIKWSWPNVTRSVLLLGPWALIFPTSSGAEATSSPTWREPRALLESQNVIVKKAEALSGNEFPLSFVFGNPACHQRADMHKPDCQKLWHEKFLKHKPWFIKWRWGVPEIIAAKYEFYKLELPAIGQQAYLFWNPNSQAKDLFIFRGGIGSRADAFGVERIYIYSLLAQYPAHILFVGSSFNNHNIFRNGWGNTGPLKDTEHNLWLLQFFRQTTWQKWIQNIYLIGLSMSGLGAFWSSAPPKDFPARPFDKVFLLCPYIAYDLVLPKELYGPAWLWAYTRFPDLRPSYPWFSHPIAYLFSEFERYHNKESPQNKTAKERWQTKTQNTKPISPVRGIYTTQDRFVPPEHNLLRLNPEQINEIVQVHFGDHCYLYEEFPSEFIGWLLIP